MASIAFITGAYTQNVTIPDANFKAALVGNASINTNMDAEIQVSEASVFNGAINVSQLYITDLTGIEAFVLLDSLDCSLNKIAGLDVSANIALTYLNCSGNIDSWQDPDIPNPFEIDNVFVYYMNILDVSTNTSLTTLKCNNNGLLNLNTSGLTSLTYLDCSDNQRVALEINSFNVVTISILTFDFLSNVALIYLDCGRNELPSLDLSGNTLLNYLDCSWNKLPNLDVSGNTFLTTLNCRYNSLTSLDVKNGNNINMFNFYAVGNPNLSCIEVDNTDWSNSNWPYIDATASFSENCSAVGILDNDESSAILAYPNPTTGTIYLSNSANITLTDLSGKLLLEEENTNQLDISSLPAGMYFLSFGENNNQIVKVVKE